MSVVRARRVGLRGDGRGVGEGDAGQVSGGESDAAAAAGASTLASAMAWREVKVIVSAAAAVVEHTAGERA